MDWGGKRDIIREIIIIVVNVNSGAMSLKTDHSNIQSIGFRVSKSVHLSNTYTTIRA